jgi:hypothetical protein
VLGAELRGFLVGSAGQRLPVVGIDAKRLYGEVDERQHFVLRADRSRRWLGRSRKV